MDDEVGSTHTTASLEKPPFDVRLAYAYAKLKADLQERATGVDEAGAPAALVLKTALAVGDFFAFMQADRALEPETHQLLIEIGAALHDKANGATVEWLDHPPRPTGITKPIHLYFHLVRGAIVGALNRVIDGGMKPEVAAKWLETQLARIGIRNPPSGARNLAPSRVTAAQCLEWRTRVNKRKAPYGQTEIANDYREVFASNRADGDLAKAKRDALAVLAHARRHNLVESPPEFTNGISVAHPPDAAFGVSKRRQS